MAKECNICGFIQNNTDGTVEICIQGNKNDIETFLKKIKEKKPPLVKYHKISLKEIKKEKKYNNFSIISGPNLKKNIGSFISPDISICNDCISELLDKTNRFHDYPFISCTDCGPKFTLFKSMPYDRINTTMETFKMCKTCEQEYHDPSNKRFHYELISCPSCGPLFSIRDGSGNIVKSENQISLIAKLIQEGNIIAIKGLGGFHIVTSSINSKPVEILRSKKNRVHKPFAVMGKDFKSIEKFANLNTLEKYILSSTTKPIVLLEKNDRYCLSSLISPNLHNIGVMLPYSGIHFLLFQYLDEPAILMTSANFKNSPIIADNEIAIKSLGSYVDYFLIHDREIFSICDDSVLKIVNNVPLLIRRARGYVPSLLYLKKYFNTVVLALGGQENVTFSIIYDNKCLTSQYIGNIENPDTFVFFKNLIKKNLDLLKLTPKYFISDLNPSYDTTKFVYDLTINESNIFQIQHHHAHIASLMLESDVDDLIGIVCDGNGYGLDGNIWGGEVFKCENINQIQRIGHLQEQPMIGGELATNYPLRILFGALYKNVDHFEKFVYSTSHYFPCGNKEIDFILRQIESKKYIRTTSTGRILDSISSLLGICYQRTYDGEPAILLESFSVNGDDLRIKPKIKNGVFDTTHLLKYLFENRNKYAIKDLACSSQVCLANGLAEIALEGAKKYDIKTIGFSGGVAYNNIITKNLKNKIQKEGIKFLTHKKFPPGDGGLSTGQAYLTINKIMKI